MSEELLITKEDLVNWLNRLPTNDDLDLIGFITTRLENFYKLEQENKQLKEDLRVSKSNEETYCLEMQEITKILGLDEHTLFDDVKYYVKQLKEDFAVLKKLQMISNDILNELEKWLKEPEYFNGRKIRQDYLLVMTTDVLDKIQELKEKYK